MADQALVAIRENYNNQIAVAQEKQNGALANSLYLEQQSAIAKHLDSRELATTETSGEVQTAAESLVNARQRAAALLDQLPPEDHQLLLKDSRWSGDGAMKQLALAGALLKDHQELSDLADRWGIPEGAQLALGAVLAEKSGYRWSAPGTPARQQKNNATAAATTTSSAPAQDLDSQIEALRTEMERLQAEGYSTRANAKYLEILALRRSAGQNQPIVGAQGRAA